MFNSYLSLKMRKKQLTSCPVFDNHYNRTDPLFSEPDVVQPVLDAEFKPHCWQKIMSHKGKCSREKEGFVLMCSLFQKEVLPLSIV